MATPPSQPAADRAAPHRRRPPILVRHAVSLAIVFALTLPLSYLLGGRIFRAQHLSKLDHPDAARFEEGLAYIYQHAPEYAWARDAALRRIEMLEPARAADLFWALGRSLIEEDPVLPNEVVEAGAVLIRRSDYLQQLALYDRLDELGAGRDPRVLDALAGVFAELEDPRFLQAVAFYDARLLWSRRFVPDAAWLRWALLLAPSESGLTQLRAAEILGTMPGWVDDPALASGLVELAQSGDAAVRSKALDVAAGFAQVAADPVPYEQVLIGLTTDTDTTLARRAWISLGLLDPVSGFSAEWSTVTPEIAEAMLWAVAQTNPDLQTPFAEAAAQEEYLAPALLALSDIPSARWSEDLRTAIEEALSSGHGVGETELLQYISAAGAGTRPDLLAVSSDQNSIDAGFQGRLGLAQLAAGVRHTSPGTTLITAADPTRAAIATLDGLLQQQGPSLLGMGDAPPPPLGSGDLAALLWALLRADEPITPYAEVFYSETHGLRDFAVFAALKSGLADDDLAALIRTRAKWPTLSAALIAGMQGRYPVLTDSDDEQVDALTALLDIAEHSLDPDPQVVETALLRLALWMRGDLTDPGFARQADAMLEDTRLPTSTVLMCLLTMHRPAALAHLLDHTGEPPLDLYGLFVGQRWWHLFKTLVPDPALELSLWGDPRAQQFQFEVMRQWYQVNRYRLEAGWWPGTD